LCNSRGDSLLHRDRRRIGSRHDDIAADNYYAKRLMIASISQSIAADERPWPYRFNLGFVLATRPRCMGETDQGAGHHILCAVSHQCISIMGQRDQFRKSLPCLTQTVDPLPRSRPFVIHLRYERVGESWGLTFGKIFRVRHLSVGLKRSPIAAGWNEHHIHEAQLDCPIMYTKCRLCPQIKES